jgi:prophage maintenance system killer protein
MVWYPTVDDVVCTNIEVLDLTGDKHPHKLLGSREGIQAVIDKVREAEGQGLTTQASMFMRELAWLQFFASGNHRTAYIVAKTFLWRNSKCLRVDGFNQAYPFIKNVEAKSISEIGRWIEHGEESMPR